MESLQTITANVSGKARRVTKRGREYMVAPITLIVPGVLPGSDGPGYYPDEEVSKNPSIWNGYPIVVKHPTINGKPVSARHPDIMLDWSGIGHIFDASYSTNKLTSEGWFDVEDTKRVDVRVYNALEQGTKLEISTGLYLDKFPAPDNAVFNSSSGPIPYTFVARNYRPDHLAVLPDERGACSVTDGCGVFNHNTVNSPITNSTDEKSLLRRIGEALGIVSPVNNELSHDQIRPLLFQALKSRFSQSDPYCYIEEVYDDYIIYSQGSELYKLSYTKLENGVTLSSDAPTKVVRELNYVTSNNENTSTIDITNTNQEEVTTNQEKKDMPLTANEKKSHIDYITANCDCWKFKDSDKTLNAMPDDNLVKLRSVVENENKNKLAINAALAGVQDKEGNMYTFNGSTGKWEVKEKETTTPVTNNLPQTFQLVNGQLVPVQIPIATPTTATTNSQLTDAEYIKSLPPGLQSVLRNAMSVEQRERTVLVDRLTMNLGSTPEIRKQHPSYARLMAKPFDELQELAALLPTPTDNSNGYPELPIQHNNYGGASAAVTTNVSGNDDLDEPLAPLDTDYGEDSPLRNYHKKKLALETSNS